VPSLVVLLPALPKSAAGKLDRRALPAPEPVRFAGDPAAAAPRTSLEATLAAAWTEVLGGVEVGRDDDFFALGGTSLQGALLLRAVEERLDLPVPVAALFEAPTVAGLARLLAERHPEALRNQRQESAGARPLVPIQAGGQGPPFFCVHPVGGDVFCYADLARHLGGEQPFYGLRSVGITEGEPLRTIEEMAATYLAAVTEVQRRGPYLLGGWSFGGVVAYEMAQQARRRGDDVEVLALIDSGAPDPAIAVEEEGERDEAELACRLVLEFARLSAGDLERATAELVALPAAERLEAALGYARRAGVLPANLSPAQAAAMARRLTAVLAANLAALRSYAPAPYSGRVVLFRAAERPAGWRTDPALGWGGLVDGGLEICELDGDHDSVLQEPRVATLAAALARAFSPQR
jgi:thioesterase domain-containing protein